GADGPRVAALLAGELGLPLPVLPWHTDRLRIVEVAAACAGATAALGKIARDVTLLAQTEVGEVREGGEENGAGPRRAGGPPGPGRGRAPGRVVRDAAQTQPGGRGRHPWLHASGAGAARHPDRRRRAGAPARGRGLAQRVAAVRGPAQAHRLRRVLGGGAARRADRGRGADAGEPRRHGRAAARRAGVRAAGA